MVPNNDYILRSDALKAVCETCSEHGEEGESCASHCGDYALIQNIPAADVELVKHGRWTEERMKHLLTGEIRPVRICTVCNSGYFRYDLSEGVMDEVPKYCPNCGAHMDAEPPKEENDAEVH